MEQVLNLVHYYHEIQSDLEFAVEKQYDKFLWIKKPNKISKLKLNLPVRIVWNACSTLVESKADVSIKDTPFFSKIINKKKIIPIKIFLPENAFASSLGTERKCRKSDLLPTSEITIFESAWSRNSFNHLSTFSYVPCLLIS